MSDPFIGEIRMFAGNFAPRSWALCNGQLLAISQNNALFALLGTTYGGNGETTFGLPDLRGRIPIHMGTGPGLSSRNLGARGGSETVITNINQMPAHTHDFRVSTDAASAGAPLGNVVGDAGATSIYSTEAPNANMSAIGATGDSQAHDNIMPFLCINFIIALFGVFPPRN